MKVQIVFLSLVVTAALCVHVFAQEPPKPPKETQAGETTRPLGTQMSPEELLAPIRARLLTDFNRRLQDPQAYAQHVRKSCAAFPEGDLFPYVYPAMAYVNVALRNPDQKENSIQNAGKLIDLAIASVARRVRPPQGRLSGLRSYQDHATYLGQLNLALGAYSLISEDGRYDVLHARLSDLLHAALSESQGRPLRSFPEYSWPFDTIPVLVSLRLYDARTSRTRSDAIIKKHLRWVRRDGTQPRLKLPYSRIDYATGGGRELPRGCDLSFRLCLLPHVDREYAEVLYKHYTSGYWLDKGVAAGFAEWPGGIRRFQDMDSGPIVMGIGLGATGLGIGAAIAVDDQQRLQRLAGQLASADILRPLFVAAQRYATGRAARELRMIALEDGCFTGFLFGDAMLFYCVTWQDWSGEKAPKANKEPTATDESAP
jgi:hypothetical protein